MLQKAPLTLLDKISIGLITVDGQETRNLEEQQENMRKFITLDKAKSSKWRHHTRQDTLYKVINYGILQTDEADVLDNRISVVYVSENDGSVWVRPYTEFFGGRFHAVND